MQMDTLNIVAGIFGVAFITLVRLKTLRDDAFNANIPFNYKKYWQRESLSIILSFLSVAIWQLLFNEISNKYHQIETFVRSSFFLMGAAGAWVLQKLLGKTKSWIRDIIDHKTNVADEVLKKDEGGE